MAEGEEVLSIKFELNDSSVFEIKDQEWIRAILMKYGDSLRELLEDIIDSVNYYWETRTVPTEYGEEVGWGDIDEGREVYNAKGEYRDQADLVPTVLYPEIKAPLTAIALEDVDKGEGPSPTIGIVEVNPDGVTEYLTEGPVSKIEYNNVEDMLNLGKMRCEEGG